VKWFDAVDVIGVSGYYDVGTKDDTSLQGMLQRWKPVREMLHKVSIKFKKPLLLIEIGVRSASKCSTMPWDYDHTEFPYDGEEQANFYESAFQTFWNEPWFLGFCWWDWQVNLPDRESGKPDTSFGIYGKPAEDVLHKWYEKPHSTITSPATMK